MIRQQPANLLDFALSEYVEPSRLPPLASARLYEPAPTDERQCLLIGQTSQVVELHRVQQPIQRICCQFNRRDERVVC